MTVDTFADLLAKGVPAYLCRPLREGKLEQACPACGRTEAAGRYCSGCLHPTGPADWHRPPVSARAAAALGRLNDRRRAQRADRASGTRKTAKLPKGQVLVEFALVVPILILLLLGTAATGFYFLAATTQANATSTIAAWAVTHQDADPDAFAAFVGRVSPCGSATWGYTPDLVTVSIDCPSIAGELLPFFPKTVTTIATGYMPEPTLAPDAVGVTP